jgi:hypothetical protein
MSPLFCAARIVSTMVTHPDEVREPQLPLLPFVSPSLDYLFFGGRYFFSIEATIT